MMEWQMSVQEFAPAFKNLKIYLRKQGMYKRK